MAARPLDPETHRAVAELTHLLILDGIARRTDWTIEDLVFQGGTSLALAWKSPRFSEDLDFVASDRINLAPQLRKVGRYVQEALLTRYPGAGLRLKEKSAGDRQNAAFHFVVDLPDIRGSVHVKTDFWRVSPNHIAPYRGTYTQVSAPSLAGEIRPILGVAVPEQIYIDKLTAVAHRDRLKWRDLFDIWYLRTQVDSDIGAVLERPDIFREVMDACGALYGKTGADAARGLARFLQLDAEDVVRQAEVDLKGWLPEAMWHRLWPQGIRDMVALVRDDCGRAMALLDPALHAPAPVGDEGGPEEP